MMERAEAAEESVAGIPLYREGSSDEESGRRLEEDRAGFLVRAYRSAGPIFQTRMGDRSWIVLAGAEANDLVWKRTELWDYPHVFPAFGEQMGPDHLNVLEGDAHRHKRAMLKPAFDQGPAMRFLPGFNVCCRAALERAQDKGAVEMVEFWAETIAWANTQTVSRVDLPDGELKRLVRWEREMLAGIFLGESRHAHYARPEYQALHGEAMALMGKIVDERLAHPDRHNDNFSAVLRARSAQPGGLPARESLIDDLYYILVAGVENTARLITWAALYSWLSPGWLERLRSELNDWDGADVAALAEMTGLKAVILETQRLRPPAFFLPRHSARDFEFAGYRIPAGASILSANTLCHFLEEYFEDPFAFRPERFMDGGRFAPRVNGFFGGGVHICLGRNYTLLQTPVALARMLKQCDLEFLDEAALREMIAHPKRQIPPEVRVRIKAGPR